MAKSSVTYCSKTGKVGLSFIGTIQKLYPKYRQQVKTKASNPKKKQGRKLSQRVILETGKNTKNQETLNQPEC